jgi:hypothetical protein
LRHWKHFYISRWHGRKWLGYLESVNISTVNTGESYTLVLLLNGV